MDVSNELNELSFNIMGYVIFGERFVYREVEYTYKGKTKKGYLGEIMAIILIYFFTRHFITKNVVCSTLLPYHITKKEKERHALIKLIKSEIDKMIEETKSNPSPCI